MKKLLSMYNIRQLFLCLMLCFLWSSSALAMEQKVVKIITEQKIYLFDVEVARTSAQKMQGLMERKSLAARAGMLFVYYPVRRVTMWMRNTLIDLDILFMDEQGKIIEIAHAQAGDASYITPLSPVHAVLEVKGGIVKQLGIKVGHEIQFAHR